MRDIICAFQERMGLNAYVSGDYGKALLWLGRLRAREGETIRVLRNLGVVLLASGDAAAAGRHFRREEELFGPSFHRHCALGDLAYAGGDRSEALGRYRAALAEPEAAGGAEPGGVPIELVRARAAICADPAAFERSRRAQERFAAAEGHREAGRLPEAAAAFEEAAALDPSHWPALNNAGTLCLNSLGQAERALGLFERAFALSRSPQAGRNAELARQALAGGDGHAPGRPAKEKKAR